MLFTWRELICTEQEWRQLESQNHFPQMRVATPKSGHPNSHKSFSIYLSLIADLEMPLPSELLPNPPLDAADPLRYPKACWSTNSTQEMSLMNKHVLLLQQILKEINITYTCNCPKLRDQVSTFPQAARWYVFACCCTIRRCRCTQSSPNKSLASDLPHQEKPRHLSWSNWSG
jgi:hypothetical protein